MQKRTVKKFGGLALGSSMLLMSMIPVASAFAAQNNPYISSVTTEGSGLNFSATSVHKPGLHVWYQFRIEKNGHWYIFQKFSKSNTVMLPANTKGTAVEAYAITQYEAQHHLWKYQVQASNNLPVTPVASISITGASSESTSAGAEILTVVAKDANGNVIANPGTVTWSISPTTGATINPLASGNSAAFSPTGAGTYTVTVTLDGKTASTTIDVYGAPVAIRLSPATTSLAADGTETDTITATVVDANGNTVGNYSGTATVTDTAGLIAAATAAGDQPSDFSDGTITFTNGVATFDVGPTAAIGLSDTIYVISPLDTGFAAASTSVRTVAPEVKGLSVSLASSSPQDLAANSESSVTVDVSTVDAQGNVTGSPAGTYATVTLSGPGSFVSGSVPGDAVTRETIYIPAGSTGGTTPITVYSLVGETGTVTLTATASGLTSSSTAIPAYLVGPPASLSVKSTKGTAANGNPYTLYTVQVLDSSGQAVPNAGGSITVSNNAAAQGGAIKTGTINASGDFTPATTFNVVNGVATFAVETTGAEGTNPVTVSMSYEGLPTVTATYLFTSEAATGLSVTPNVYYTVKPGQSVTFAAQVVDANGNPVSGAGVPVTFRFDGGNTGGFATFPDGLTSETVDTNTSGVASVTFTIPSNAGPRVPLQVTATSKGLATGISAMVNVEPATNSENYATSVSLSDSSGPVTSVTESADATGTTLAANGVTINAVAENAVGQPVGENDVLQITSSNPNVVAPTNGTVTSNGGVSNVARDLTLGMAGSAVVTVTDISNPTMPSATFAVNVTPGLATKTIVEYNGAPIPSTGMSVAANTPIPLTIVNTDPADDPIPVTGSTPLNVDVNTTAKDAVLIGTSGGGPISSVQIQPGAVSTVVYFETSVGQTIYPSEFTAMPSATVAAPTNIMAKETATGATVTWTPPTTVPRGGYQIWQIPVVNGNPDFKQAKDIKTVDSNATSFAVTNLTAGDSYEFNVDSVDGYGNVAKGTPTASVEYGTSATSAVSTAFSPNTSAHSGEATFTLTMDKNLDPKAPISRANFGVMDSTAHITYQVRSVTVSGNTVTIETTIPSGTVAAPTDTVVITAKEGALMDAADAPSAAISESTSNSAVSPKNSTVKLSATSVAAGTPLTVSGAVNDPNGNPVGFATVTVTFDGVSAQTTTKSDGSYSVSLTPAKAVVAGYPDGAAGSGTVVVAVTPVGGAATTISTASDVATVSEALATATQRVQGTGSGTPLDASLKPGTSYDIITLDGNATAANSINEAAPVGTVGSGTPALSALKGPYVTLSQGGTVRYIAAWVYAGSLGPKWVLYSVTGGNTLSSPVTSTISGTYSMTAVNDPAITGSANVTF